jgi:hypothetical protein
MERDIALRLDALLVNLTGNIDLISEFMKNNMSDEEFSEYVPHMGHCMFKAIELSEKLRKIYPDIATGNLKRDL